VGKHHAAFELKCAMEENNLQKKGSAPQHQPLAGCPRDFGLGDTSAGICPPQEEFDWESWLSADSAIVPPKGPTGKFDEQLGQERASDGHPDCPTISGIERSRAAAGRQLLRTLQAISPFLST